MIRYVRCQVRLVRPLGLETKPFDHLLEIVPLKLWLSGYPLAESARDNSHEHRHGSACPNVGAMLVEEVQPFIKHHRQFSFISDGWK